MADFTVVFVVKADSMEAVEADVQTWTPSEGSQLVSIQGQVTSSIVPAVADAEGNLVKATPESPPPLPEGKPAEEA